MVWPRGLRESVGMDYTRVVSLFWMRMWEKLSTDAVMLDHVVEGDHGQSVLSFLSSLGRKG